MKKFRVVNKRLIISPGDIHNVSEKHGWWGTDREVPECLCLIHSEVSEALEVYRECGQDGRITRFRKKFGEELADIIIRTFDLAFHHDIDIIEAVEKKHRENIDRPYRHGGKKC